MINQEWSKLLGMSKKFLLTVMLLMAAVPSYANNIYRVTAYSLEEEGDGLYDTVLSARDYNQ